MITIRNSDEMARALASSIDTDLRRLLALRRDQLMPDELGGSAQFIVVQPGDTLAGVEGGAGVPLATNLVDGTRLGEPDFTPSFEWIQHHPGWIEAVLILSDDGFAHVLLLPDRDDIDPALLALIRAHA